MNIESIRIITTDEFMPGDIGYITHLHGKIYFEEYGYTKKFEEYVSATLFDYDLKKDNHKFGRIWFIMDNNRMVGTIASVIKNHTAQIRWFVIEREYRKMGYGSKLLSEAIEYSYKYDIEYISLSTTSDLKDARRLYEKNGFTLVESKENNEWKQGIYELEYIKHVKDVV